MRTGPEIIALVNKAKATHGDLVGWWPESTAIHFRFADGFLIVPRLRLDPVRWEKS